MVWMIRHRNQLTYTAKTGVSLVDLSFIVHLAQCDGYYRGVTASW